MGDRPAFVTSRPGQLSLAVRPWTAGAVSSNVNSEGNCWSGVALARVTYTAPTG